jgi:hypothetical protein
MKQRANGQGYAIFIDMSSGPMQNALAQPDFSLSSFFFFDEIWRGRSLYSDFIKEVKKRIYTREAQKS